MQPIGSQRPDRMGLYNYATEEGFNVQFNPATVRERVAANWKRTEIPGLSHEILFYANTTSHELAFALKFAADSEPLAVAIDDLKRFMLSLLYPTGEGQPPPDVLFTWPNNTLMEGVLSELSITNEAYTPDGRLTEFTADITFVEKRRSQIFGNEVRAQGSQRQY